MIIFDLAALANDEHRRHFIDPYENPAYEKVPENNELGWKEGFYCNLETTPHFGMPWKPDYQAYYDACDMDEPVKPVIEMMDSIYQNTINFWKEVHLWSERPESIREKTTKWMKENVLWDSLGCEISLKLRPIGDTRPQEQLFEEWLDSVVRENGTVRFVFSAHKPTIEMFRRRGIFVFDCGQDKY